ncbi:hypothetical protein RRG08_045499 [Elysia crispata]|uniref:Uncharacterized protein n=1 Tax=Elysia crispata TaxID=231223 RepID=A0AAE1AE15_9GAST|nr:hypothetical protein RRG08_045499 [Elysia crispata]
MDGADQEKPKSCSFTEPSRDLLEWSLPVGPTPAVHTLIGASAFVVTKTSLQFSSQAFGHGYHLSVARCEVISLKQSYGPEVLDPADRASVTRTLR